MDQRKRLIELLKETFEYTRGTCIDFDEAAEINADYLLAHGVIVPPCKVGDKVYAVLYDPSTDEKYFISEEHITEVGMRGFWISSFDPPRDDMGPFIPFTELGTEIFLTQAEAEKALAERSNQ